MDSPSLSAGPTATVTLDEVAAHVAAVDRATDLPVSVDLENGYGAAPEAAAVAIAAAAAAGAAGGSIEDYDRDETRVYELGEAVERVAAAAEAARALDFQFTFTARAENFLRGKPDLDDTISRLHAYAEAGADVLYAPGLRNAAEIKAVCGAVSKPVNVLAFAPSACRSARSPKPGASASASAAGSPGPPRTRRSRPPSGCGMVTSRRSASPTSASRTG